MCVSSLTQKIHIKWTVNFSFNKNSTNYGEREVKREKEKRRSVAQVTVPLALVPEHVRLRVQERARPQGV